MLIIPKRVSSLYKMDKLDNDIRNFMEDLKNERRRLSRARLRTVRIYKRKVISQE